MPYLGRQTDPPIQHVLRDWAGWRRSVGQAQGWGLAAHDYERAGSRSNTAYSDPVAAEYQASQMAGEGVYRFVDRRLAEHYPIVQRVMLARYVAVLAWHDVAQAVGCTVNQARILHDRCSESLDEAVRAYLRIDPVADSVYGQLYRARERGRVRRRPVDSRTLA